MSYSVRHQKVVGILPMGQLPDPAPKIMAAHVSGFLRIRAEMLPAVGAPEYAMDAGRLQYDAGKIVSHLERQPIDGYEKILAVLSLDLFVPIFTFVFGESRQGGRAGIVSLCRLGRNPDGSEPPAPVSYERMAKVGLHELGHLYHLSHCLDAGCLMHFCGGLGELDETPLRFCRYCRLFIRESMPDSVPAFGSDQQGTDSDEPA